MDTQAIHSGKFTDLKLDSSLMAKEVMQSLTETELEALARELLEKEVFQSISRTKS